MNPHQGFRYSDSEMQRHPLNPLLNVICRILGWNYFWFRYDRSRRKLFIGNTREAGRWQFIL